MAQNCSFKEYIKKNLDNNLWALSEEWLRDNFDPDEFNYYKIHRPGEYELADVSVEHIWTGDLPGTEIKFDVKVSLIIEVHEADHHYDEIEEKKKYLLISFQGDLALGLSNTTPLEVLEFNGKNYHEKPMDDTLVPYISQDKYEETATAFLKKYYPEALVISPKGNPPVWVDPIKLAQILGLEVKQHNIAEDSTIFGQIYFFDSEATFYDNGSEEGKKCSVKANTIVVDPAMYLLRNVGSVNNTIVHECVHFAEHRKAFLLESLFSNGASSISCQVVGGASAAINKKSTDFMEMQANQLAPRIQMPAVPFRAKVNEYISMFMKASEAAHTVDVMELVIQQLALDYAVSKQAAKIRLVQLGFEEAAGTFIYLDGHYVKPHSYKKGAIQLNQTFSVTAQDAAIQRFSNLELREKTQNGDYLFIDNHMVYNAPLYVQHGVNDQLELTDYARSHMDECCLVFDMTIVTNIEHTYHTECFLNRDSANVTFEVKYHNGYQNATQTSQIAIRQKEMEEAVAIRKQMTDDPEQCMELILKWRNRTYTDLGDAIDRNPRTISRTVKGETSPQVDTAVLICFELNLPPMISEKLLEVLGCKLSITKIEHQWINEALHLKYPEPLWAVREYLEQYGVEI